MCKKLLVFLLLSLILPTVVQSQTLNVDLGGYYTGNGAHPHVGFLIRGGVDVESPNIGLRLLEFEHATIPSSRPVSDLMALRAGIWVPVYRTDALYIYGLALGGSHQYRLWVCEELV